ncbi:hypothetical protein BD779DRAFT_59911 [Infundibulicybe gibba]|nr:hypothetical protein BD779DRAFT_59911 [Infundibulicybe gibba]
MGDFDQSVGLLLMGLFLNTYLYGLVTYQFIVYYNTKFHDPLWIRAVVASLFVLDTVHSGVAVYSGWETCVQNYNNPASLLYVGWTIPFTAAATAAAALITQAFLGHRVFILTKSKPLVSIIGVLAILGFFFGVYCGVYSGQLNDVRLFDPLRKFVTCWLVFQTSADVIITFVLTTVLSRSRTGFRKTDSIINRLIRGAIQTGLFASIFALADLFSFLLDKDSYLYAFFAYPLGRIYTNTLMDTLNARITLKNMTSTMDVDSESNTNAFRLQNQSQTLASGHTMHSIHVQKEVVSDAPEDRSVDAKYSGTDEVYAHPTKMA